MNFNTLCFNALQDIEFGFLYDTCIYAKSAVKDKTIMVLYRLFKDIDDLYLYFKINYLKLEATIECFELVGFQKKTNYIDGR